MEDDENSNIWPVIGHQVIEGDLMLVSLWCENGNLATYIAKNAQLERVERLKLVSSDSPDPAPSLNLSIPCTSNLIIFFKLLGHSFAMRRVVSRAFIPGPHLSFTEISSLQVSSYRTIIKRHYAISGFRESSRVLRTQVVWRLPGIGSEERQDIRPRSSVRGTPGPLKMYTHLGA